jgi:hypothetical protein
MHTIRITTRSTLTNFKLGRIKFKAHSKLQFSCWRIVKIFHPDGGFQHSEASMYHNGDSMPQKREARELTRQVSPAAAGHLNAVA